MKFKVTTIGILLIVAMAATSRAHSQASEIENLFHNLEAMDAGTQGPFDKADPILEQLVHSSRENIVAALPVILHATSNPHLSVRRVAAMALFQLTRRPEGQALLATDSPTFAALLTDTDIPIRRVTAMAIDNLRLNGSSPLVAVLETYLSREDAVSTIGAGVAGLLMKAAPNGVDSTSAVVQFMRREDQTSQSQHDTLQSIRVAKSHSREIGKEVTGYADEPNEQLSTDAIETLQGMGKDVLLDNQPALSQIAADTTKSPIVRAAATKALSTVL